ncbi:MAG: TetR/AcrR family transcriptional regulator [Clostridiales bacterium]|nr:TetR/AcrR family transcriptional regulator [Clostridiales bacterium]
MCEKIDLRVKKTYIALFRSFEKLSKTKDFGDITVNEICDNAMVGKGTFYSHFTDKYDFLSFLINNVFKDYINKAFENASSDNLCEYYKEFFLSFIDILETEKHSFKPAGNSLAMGIALSHIGSVYNKLLEPLQKADSENRKLNSFTAEYLSILLILVLFKFASGENYNSDDVKMSISVLLEKIFA